MNRLSHLFHIRGSTTSRCACILLGLVMLGLSGVTVQADPVKAVVDSVSGTVEFAPPGSASYSPLKKGQELEVGSAIRTEDDGTAIISTTPGSAIQVGNNSNLRLTALAFAKSGSTVTQRQAHIDLTSGVVSALVDPSTPKITDFKVQTPQGGAAARGTFYAVAVVNGKTYVSVDQGKVGAEATPRPRSGF